MVSINAGLEIDLFSQVCSESVGTRHISGAGGQLMKPLEVVQKNIFDELAADETELIEKAKAKVRRLIDTPGRPFIMLKYLEKRHAAEIILDNHTKAVKIY